MCSLHLADMGADVIKVEDPVQGDYARVSGGYYHSINRNKRSIGLDLKKEDGREIFLRLADTADVIMEGFRPGVVDRLGIGYEVVRRRNPKIIYCAITGYGQTGPYRQRAGHDLNYCSYSGVLEQIGAADGPPVIPNFQIADLLGGSLSAAMGILAVLVEVQRTALGRHVDVAMADCTLAHSVLSLMAYRRHGETRPRGCDTLSGGVPWYSVYETADGRHVALAALEKKFWSRFCEGVDRLDWLDVQDSNNDGGLRELRRQMVELFKSNTQSYWVERLEAADCCFSPVLTLDEALHHRHFQERGMVMGDCSQFAFPVQFTEFAADTPSDAPGHGQHTRQVLQELGCSDEEVSGLVQSGAI
jgi:crotonobetainyl-CoA:carnitine CoA-transferase CaiB-like acyl-CoA transferase